MPRFIISNLLPLCWLYVNDPIHESLELNYHHHVIITLAILAFAFEELITHYKL